MTEPAARTSIVPKRRAAQTTAGLSADVPWPFDERRSRRSLEPPPPHAHAVEAQDSLAGVPVAPPPASSNDETTPPGRPRFHQTLRQWMPDLPQAPAALELDAPFSPTTFSPTTTLSGMPAPVPAPAERLAAPTVSGPLVAQPLPSGATADPAWSSSAYPARPAFVEPTDRSSFEHAASRTRVEPRLLPAPAAAESLTDADAIADDGLEVTLLWTVDDDLVDTLHVAHLFPPRPFVLGERKADYVAGRETIGCDRLPIVTVDESGVWIVVPEGATGELSREGRRDWLDAIDARGDLAPSGEAPGARRLLLTPGSSASITLSGGLTYQVRRVTRPKSLAAFRRRSFDGRAIAAAAASLVFNVGLVLGVILLGVMPPAPAPVAPLAELRPARIVPRPPPPEEAVTRTTVRSFEGERHRGAEGRAGRPDAPETRRRLGIQGTTRVRTPARADTPPPPAPPTPTPPVVTPPVPQPQVQPPRPSPLPPSPIPTPPARVANMPNWPTSSAATATVATGPDPRSAQGNLTGAQIGDARGAGGLGLRGTGPGGGGTGSGIGGGRVDMGQWGMDVGVSPVAREQVRRVIRSHTAQIRACYAGATGRVTLRLVVNQSGAVQAVRAQGSQASGDQCAERAVRTWSFPSIPNSGITIVTVPVSLGGGQDA